MLVVIGGAGVGAGGIGMDWGDLSREGKCGSSDWPNEDKRKINCVCPTRLDCKEEKITV